MIDWPVDAAPAWCPGCGNFALLKTLDRAIDSAGIDRRNLVLVSGIGQAAKLPHYTRANVFNGLHGRALPAATGIKVANHKLEVVITSGDGDMYGEGGNHLIHAFRRNVGVKVFVHNNQVYGLTKGQASPTSDLGFATKIQTHGVILQPLLPELSEQLLSQLAAPKGEWKQQLCWGLLQPGPLDAPSPLLQRLELEEAL